MFYVFSIFSTNIQSIKSKFDELKIFIEHIGTLGIGFSAICTQESTISEGDDLSQLQLKGYNLVPQGKSCTAKGGLIIYSHEQFKYDYKSKLNKCRTWEGQVIQLKNRGNLNKPINIVNIYRPPNDLLDSYNEFIKELSPVLSTLQNNNNEVRVAGDFNINLLQINDTHVFGEYFDKLTSHSFYPKITLPTRLSNNYVTLIDNFLCKLTETMLDTTSGILIKKVFRSPAILYLI